MTSKESTACKKAPMPSARLMTMLRPNNRAIEIYQLAIQEGLHKKYSASQEEILLMCMDAAYKEYEDNCKYEAKLFLEALESPNKLMTVYSWSKPISRDMVIQLLALATEKHLKKARIVQASHAGKANARKLDDPTKKIRELWAGGDFTSKDICAEQNYESCGFNSFKTARNKLVGIPKPNPWPAKETRIKPPRF